MRDHRGLPLALIFAGKRSIAIVTKGFGSRLFCGRVAILMNEDSTGTAEMLAQFTQENQLGTIVGSKTAGRLVLRSDVTICNGYTLVLPVAAYLSWNGDRIEGNGITGGVRNYRLDATVDAAPIAPAVRQYCFTTERVRWPVISATVSGLIPLSEHCVTRPGRKLCAAILAMSDAGKPALLAARLRMRGIQSGLRLSEMRRAGPLRGRVRRC